MTGIASTVTGIVCSYYDLRLLLPVNLLEAEQTEAEEEEDCALAPCAIIRFR